MLLGEGRRVRGTVLDTTTYLNEVHITRGAHAEAEVGGVVVAWGRKRRGLVFVGLWYDGSVASSEMQSMKFGY